MEQFLAGLEGYLHSSFMLAVMASFAGGVMASLTPCVYPMVPITASTVASNNLGGSKARGFLLALTYVVGVAVTYAALGMFAALTGRLFGEVNSSPLAMLVVGNIVLVCGLAMLEVFEAPFLQFGSQTSKRGFWGVLLLGMASGLVAGPCTAPVLAILLAYVATTQSVLGGAVLLFVFALGMGMLLLVVGAFSALIASLPRSGQWMVRIKTSMGWLMVGVAQYFIFKAGQLAF